MARQDALLRLHKTLTARRAELRKRLGRQLEDLAHTKHTAVSGDAADAAFDASGEEMASTLAELEAKYDAQFKVVFDAIRALMEPDVTSEKKKRIGFRDPESPDDRARSRGIRQRPRSGRA